MNNLRSATWHGFVLLVAAGFLSAFGVLSLLQFALIGGFAGLVIGYIAMQPGALPSNAPAKVIEAGMPQIDRASVRVADLLETARVHDQVVLLPLRDEAGTLTGYVCAAAGTRRAQLVQHLATSVLCPTSETIPLNIHRN